jgi:hypothetical protein
MHTDVDIVLPGEDYIISSFGLTGELPAQVINGDVSRKYAIAILYGPSTRNDKRRWITDAWVAFSCRKKAFALRKHDEIEVDSRMMSCNLKDLEPKDWLQWQPPSLNQ